MDSILFKLRYCINTSFAFTVLAAFCLTAVNFDTRAYKHKPTALCMQYMNTGRNCVSACKHVGFILNHSQSGPALHSFYIYLIEM